MPDEAPELEVGGRRSDSARAKGRVTFTRTDVIRAGGRLLDAEGVDNLSMRRLAKVLKTGSSTLYWHVKDKDELMLLILDDTMAGVVIADEGGWDERLIETLMRMYRALAPRPALIDVLWGRTWGREHETRRVADGLIGLVAQSGLPDEDVVDSYFALATLVFGFVAGADRAPEHPGRAGRAKAPAHEAGATDALERYPNLARYAPDISREAVDRRCEDAVARFVAGIRAATEGR